jgi:tetratricopeptide (TPR) repeat protein
LVGLPPDYVGIKVNLGLLYNGSGRFADTVRLLDSLGGLDSYGPAAWIVLGTARLGTGDAAGAVQAMEQAAALAPADPAVLQGLAAARRAALDGAAAQATEALILASPNATLATYDLVGSRLQATAEFARAEAVFRAMTGRFPQEAAAHFRLGTFLAFMTRYAEAATVLGQAAALAPARPDIARARALTASRMGDHEGAVAQAKAMLGLSPQPSIEDRFLLAALREDARDAAGAERDYRAILKEAEFAPAMNNLAAILLNRDEAALALPLAERAAALAPNAGWAQSTHGWTLFRLGQLDRAKGALERAFAAAPEDPTVLYHLAELRAALGETVAARNLVQAALGKGRFVQEDRARALAERLP